MTSEEVLQAIRLQWEVVLQGKASMTRHGYVRREHVAELSIWGRGLDALDKADEYQSAVTSIHFHYILIDTLCGEIARLLKFKGLSSITFIQNQILDPRALEPFRRMSRLTDVVIKENPVCTNRANLRVSHLQLAWPALQSHRYERAENGDRLEFGHFEVGIIRWLPHLRKINDQDVTDLERADACNLQAALHLVVRKCVLVGARGNGLAKHQLKKLSVLVVVGGGAGVVEGAEFGPVLPSPEPRVASAEVLFTNGDAFAWFLMLHHACTVDERISAVHEHFREVVRDAISEVWCDLAETSSAAPPMPLPSTGFTIDE
ncbi:OLA1 [Symbiodinium natans]|uniref:OLA1 protein n=1 Tax=Symbiodinium natans TaxID=878477 RepID=A0A812PLN9_9DINO|nr:OLA1 [Symbiodinium natans]